jgi:hypothetical protein
VLVLSVFLYHVLLAHQEGLSFAINKNFDPHCEPTKHDREKRTAPTHSGSKNTPIYVKIGIVFVNLFFLKNPKGPPLGDLRKNKQKPQIPRFVDFLQIG